MGRGRSESVATETRAPQGSGALLTAEQREELARALTKPPPDGGMWSSRKVGEEWVERRTGRALSNNKQRGWEYLRRLGNSPKVPRPHHASADEREQEEAFKKGSG